MNALHQYASGIGDTVLHELEKAEEMATNGFFTEACTRLGRAQEASLYITAQELEVDISKRAISDIQQLQKQIEKVETAIIKNKNLEDIKGLSKCSTMLADCIINLTHSATQMPEILEGKLMENSTTSNARLFQNLIEFVQDDFVKRRLKSANKDSLIQHIQNRRNHAAHASTEGTVRELEEHHYEGMLKDVERLLKLLFELKVSKNAYHFWYEKLGERVGLR